MESSRPPLHHVVLIDGTFASLDPDQRSSIGKIYAALSGLWGPLPSRVQIRYEPGQQWETWRTLSRLAAGSELESRIMGAYLWLARQWHPGDPLFLFGYSRGAFAIRSLAGMIGKIGLLRPSSLNEGNIRRVWQMYRQGADREELARFRQTHCHDHVPIRMVGVFDTVVALGIRLPLLWMLAEPRYRFHDHELGSHVELGAQALALDETRAAFAPLLWSSDPQPGRVRQMWFRGCHPDIGGQLSGAEFARPLANIPLSWMMETASEAGLPLPDGWRDKLPCDASAPSVGSWRYWGKAFLARAPRMAGADPSEALHPSVALPYGGPALLTGHLSEFAADRIRPRIRPRKAPKASPPAADDPSLLQTGPASSGAWDGNDETSSPPQGMSDQPPPLAVPDSADQRAAEGDMALAPGIKPSRLRKGSRAATGQVDPEQQG